LYLFYPIRKPTFYQLALPKEGDLAKGAEKIIQNLYGAETLITSAIPVPASETQAVAVMQGITTQHPRDWPRFKANEFDIEDFLAKLPADTGFFTPPGSNTKIKQEVILTSRPKVKRELFQDSENQYEVQVQEEGFVSISTASSTTSSTNSSLASTKKPRSLPSTGSKIIEIL
jgi:hypothetical protein